MKFSESGFISQEAPKGILKKFQEAPKILYRQSFFEHLKSYKGCAEHLCGQTFFEKFDFDLMRIIDSTKGAGHWNDLSHDFGHFLRKIIAQKGFEGWRFIALNFYKLRRLFALHIIEDIGSKIKNGTFKDGKVKMNGHVITREQAEACYEIVKLIDEGKFKEASDAVIKLLKEDWLKNILKGAGKALNESTDKAAVTKESLKEAFKEIDPKEVKTAAHKAGKLAAKGQAVIVSLRHGWGFLVKGEDLETGDLAVDLIEECSGAYVGAAFAVPVGVIVGTLMTASTGPAWLVIVVPAACSSASGIGSKKVVDAAWKKAEDKTGFRVFIKEHTPTLSGEKTQEKIAEAKEAVVEFNDEHPEVLPTVSALAFIGMMGAMAFKIALGDDS